MQLAKARRKIISEQFAEELRVPKVRTWINICLWSSLNFLNRQAIFGFFEAIFL